MNEFSDSFRTWFSGVSAILLKPYDMNYLVEMIDKLSLGDSIQEPLREVTWK